MRRRRKTDGAPRVGKNLSRDAGRVQGERGMVIVVALLVLLSLAAVAVVAAYRVSSEIDRSGYYRTDKNGQTLTQVGFAAGISLMEHQANLFVPQIRAQQGVPVVKTRDQFVEAGLLGIDLTETGAIGHQIDANNVDFVDEYVWIEDVDGGVAGYSAGEYTFSRVAMTTKGVFSESEVGPPEKRSREANRQMRVFMLVGPQTQTQIQQ